MESILSHEETISRTYENVSKFSYSVKKISYEEKVNNYLDQVNGIKKTIIDRTDKLNEINDNLENITWYDDLGEDCLRKVNDIIILVRDLHRSLVELYVVVNNAKHYGICKTAIRNFKDSIDNLREISDDLDSVFFKLPHIEGFTDTAEKLAQL